eukprot:9008569-Alexandrium_andersonii.AAC.1
MRLGAACSRISMRTGPRARRELGRTLGAVAPPMLKTRSRATCIGGRGGVCARCGAAAQPGR